jgi:hypothetical protein
VQYRKEIFMSESRSQDRWITPSDSRQS